MKRLYFLLIICVAWLPLKAQVAVSIQILPPYPTKITDYASRPQLMLISVRSTSNSDRPQRVQLRGAITGDNGVELRVRSNYKSVSAIPLAKGEVRMLNGNDLKYFFDYTKIDYKGITQSDFINKNGLPEGTYRFCIRAYDYDSGAPLSADEPVGCSNSFTISSLEPPTIIAPLADASISSAMGQTILFQWSTPPGTSPQIMSSVRYRIRMVEIIGNRNPNNALMSATQPYFFQKEVMGNNYVYGPADPQLTPGRKYAFMVEAYDPFNSTPFRNNGRSEVRSFTYTAQANLLPIVKLPSPLAPAVQHTVSAAIPNIPSCDCYTAAGTATSNNALLPDVSVVSVGNFKMHIKSSTLGNNGLANGEGTMELPFVGSTPGARLRVRFTDLDVGTDLKMKSGQVEGILSGDAATLIPKIDNPQLPNLQMQPADAQHLKDYFSTHTQQMLTNIKGSGDNGGFELPLGISKGPITIAMSRIYFNATQAWFEAAASVDVPDGGDKENILAFVGNNICISSADGFCKEGQLYLSRDFNISALNMVLKKKGTDPVKDPGTVIQFNKDGLVNLSISADYTFKANTLMNMKNEALTANLTVLTSKGWTDWLAEVKIPQFYIAGMKSISFDMGGKPMYYDHSDFKNPDMPGTFPSPTPGEAPIVITPNLWHGFYIPEITVNMPAIIKNTAAGANDYVSIAGKQIIIDANGITGHVQSTGQVLTLGNGSMGGWYASIDHVDLAFFKSAFKNSSMTGKVVLPASTSQNASNQLDYSATLTTPSGTSGISYAINILPGNGALSFDALFMNVTLDGNTQILVEGNTNNPFRAEANLTGDLSIASDPKTFAIPGLGKLSLPHIRFGNLKFQTDGNFINTDQFYCDLTSAADGGKGGGGAPGSGFDGMPDEGGPGGPSVRSYLVEPANNFNAAPGGFAVQQKLAGFNFSLSSSGLKVVPGTGVGTSVGMSFNGDVSLAEAPIACKAKGTFTLSSGIKKDAQTGRIVWTGIGGTIDSVSLGASANLGALKIKGAIKYYNEQAKHDEGFIGALETGIADLVTINMRAQFGMITNSSQGDYNYFSFNAMADLGQTGITFAPPVPIALYGFGGGVYYNMDLDTAKMPKPADVPVVPKTSDTKNVPPTATSSHDPNADDALALLGSNPANLTLTPHKGPFGLQATVLFGLLSRNTLDMDATFSIGFDPATAGGLKFVKLNGNARILTDVSKPLSERRASSTGAGSVNIIFNRPGNTFMARLDMELGVPFVGDTSLLHAVGGGEFYYAGKEDWHIKIGSPRGDQPGPNRVSVLNFIHGESYFEVGTNIDPMPEIPDEVLKMAGKQTSNLQPLPGGLRTYNADATDHNPSGLIMGASASLGDPNKEYHFLMFFGTLYAQTGFDLSLLKGVSCDNVNAPGGPGGWYARGQAYFGAKAKIGIAVNLLLIKGKFTIFEAGAGAIIQAGLPKPAWAEGTIGGYFSIMDGAIASNFHFGFSVGTKCIDANSDPFGGLEIISQVTPPNGGAKPLELTVMPAVVFNLKNGGQYGSSAWVNGDFEFDDYEKPDKNGNPAKRFFRFDKSCLAITLNGTDVMNKMTRLDSAFALGYHGDGYLVKNTQYNFKVVAKMLEGHGGFIDQLQGNYSIKYDAFVKKSDNSGDATQEMQTTFTTDSGFTAIPGTEYAMTGPLHSDKVVPTHEFGGINGKLWYIETKKTIENSKFFRYPEGTTYMARVFRNGVKEGADLAVTQQVVNSRMNDGVPKSTIQPGDEPNLYNGGHSRWTFMGPELQKGSNYVVAIIAKLPQAGNQNNDVGLKQTSATLGGAGIDNSMNTKGSLITGNPAINKATLANSDVLNDVARTFQISTLTRTIANHLNTLAGGENIAAAFNFRTSSSATYSEKFSALQINKLVNNNVMNTTISPSRIPAQNLQTIKQWISPVNGQYPIRLGSGFAGFNFPVQVTFVGEAFSKADIEGTTSDEVFQPDYDDNQGSTHRNFTIKRLYTGIPQTDYGTDYIRLRTFIAANTSIPIPNITVTYTSPGTPVDQGALYSYISGGEDISYSSTRSSIGAKVPTALPQVNNNIAQIGETGMAGLLTGLPSFLNTPIVYADFSPQNLIVKSRGQATYTNEIQKQIDKLKNWAINPGDNVQTQSGMSNVGVWESVSTAAAGYMNGTVKQGQLQGAIQGAAQVGAQMR